MEYRIIIGGVDDETNETVADSAYAYETIETDDVTIAYGAYMYDTGGDGDGSYIYKVVIHKHRMSPPDVYRGLDDSWYAKIMNSEEEDSFEEEKLTDQEQCTTSDMISFLENYVWFNGDNNSLYMREEVKEKWEGKSELRSAGYKDEFVGYLY
ncbi:MAG: hypothetical protein HY795_02380 [Desulfovibrio sp.]|nr:hypothetical protein [Desulfovibrio sp.]